MPPHRGGMVANPNPTRASRTADAAADAQAPPAIITAATSTTNIVGASPSAAAAAIVPAAEPAPAAAPVVRAPVFNIMPARATGLQQTQVAERKRTVDVRHDDPAWQCVEITEDTSNPRWRCLGCGECRSGSATRVVDHLLGRNRAAACNLSTANDAFKAALAKVKESEGKKEQKKEHKKAVVAVNAAASKGAIVVQQR